MKYALVDTNNKVVNIIAYDGTSAYETKPNIRLMQVNDWINIDDDHQNAAKIGVPTDSSEMKKQRNDLYKVNIGLKAAFRIEKRTSPLLTFSDYIDQLELEFVDDSILSS